MFFPNYGYNCPSDNCCGTPAAISLVSPTGFDNASYSNTAITIRKLL